MGKSFSSFYGDYCGTRLLNANFVFCQVRRFWERSNYGLLPETIIASWLTTPIESLWFDNEEIYWENDYTVSLVDSTNIQQEQKYVLFYGNATKASPRRIEELKEALMTISGKTLKVCLVENVFVTVLASCNIEEVDKGLFDGWKISYTD